MENILNAKGVRSAKKVLVMLALCAVCVLLNFAGSQLATVLSAPLYLDSLGVVLASAFGGYIPGIIVGYATNFTTSVSDPSSIYYCIISVLIAVVSGFSARRGWFDKPYGIPLVIVLLAFVGGVLGSIITCMLYGPLGGGISEPFALLIYNNTGLPAVASQVSADFLIDLLDKSIIVVVASALMQVVPPKVKQLFEIPLWQQTPLEGEQLATATKVTTRGLSLRTKIVAVVTVVMLIVAAVTAGLSFVLYHQANIAFQSKTSLGIANLAAKSVNPNRVNAFLERGENASGYRETEEELAAVRDNFVDVQYVYVYQIRADGCHVVFDPDTDEAPGSETGEVIPFDNAFMPYVPKLLAGEPIDPIISNESYGWLLTAYVPLYDNNGDCTCYVAVDVSMDRLMADEYTFLMHVLILFAAFFVLICAVIIWLVDYGVILPINSIAHASSSFAFDNKTLRSDSVDQLRQLNISTGDEVENLYHTVTKTSEDTVEFIAESQEKADTIERMQDNLIMVMADLVESRDKHTGDHVRKTAAYTRVIMEQMRREGMFPDVLTEEYINDVEKAAPLHDVGKIVVSDAILNKPGRLTDEEFEIMKSHTTAGEEILADAVGAVSDAGYLDEARRLAAFHHEKWNGKGYPYGAEADEIPLSARIMAVADVFDALVSKRSYKDGMPIEKALDIIRNDAGTHFDPQVAQAFLDAEDEVRRIAEQHGDAHGVAADIRDA